MIMLEGEPIEGGHLPSQESYKFVPKVTAEDLISVLATALGDRDQVVNILLSGNIIKPTDPPKIIPDWREVGESLGSERWQAWQSIASALNPLPESTIEDLLGNYQGIKDLGQEDQIPYRMLRNIGGSYGKDLGNLSNIYNMASATNDTEAFIKRLKGVGNKNYPFMMLLLEQAGLLPPSPEDLENP